MPPDPPASAAMPADRPALLRVAAMPAVTGLAVPSQFYCVTAMPVRIAGMSYPSAATPWSDIGKLGFRHVICLTEAQPRYTPSPLRLAYATALQDLVSGDSPVDPDKEERLIREAVAAARDQVLRREGIVIHCAGGTGRTGTVIGCLLRTLGYDGEDIIAYLRTLNQARGRHGWPEAAWQGELVRRF
jgi:hypothetical protein